MHDSGLDLGACCRSVLRVLGGVGGKLDLADVLRAFHSRAERVIAFLAVLEMARLRWVGISQGEHLGPAPGVPHPRRLVLLNRRGQESVERHHEHAAEDGDAEQGGETPSGYTDTGVTLITDQPQDGVSAEVIDLRSIRPFDEDTIVQSVEKTHRAVTVQEQWRWFGVASEVAAIIQDQAFDSLDAPVQRVSGAEVPTETSKKSNRRPLPVPAKFRLSPPVRLLMRPPWKRSTTYVRPELPSVR